MANVTARKIETIGAELSAKLEEHNSLIFAEKLTEARPVYDAIIELVAEYNEASRLDTFGELRAIGDKIQIMREACKKYEYPAIKVSEVKVDGTAMGTYEVVDTTKVIDLIELHKYCTGGIGAKTTWAPKAEKSALVITQRVADDIAAHNADQIGGKFKLSKGAKALADDERISNGDILRTLRTMVEEMIGEEYTSKVVSCDVKFMLYAFTREGKTAGTIRTAKTKTAVRIMMQLCRKILLDQRYGVDFPGYKK